MQIFKETGGSGGVVQKLPPFTTVTLVKSERGWLLIARDGKVLGYAADQAAQTQLTTKQGRRPTAE